MATGTSPAAAPAASPRSGRAGAPGWAPAAAVIVGVAVVLKLVYRPWHLNYDARYALLWARDAWTGHKPEYLADFAPTPHPLQTAVSSLALPFGDHADTVLVWAILLCFGAVVWLVYRLGAELFNPWVGFAAAAAVFTRPALQRDALLAYQDVPFALLILSAVLVEARAWRGAGARGWRAAASAGRRGLLVPILLALAGLMRPEAWVLSGLYLLYVWPAADPRRRAAVAAVAASAPVIWALSDWVVTGDPLHSLHGTAELAEAVDRRRHLWQVPYWSVQYFGYILREPLIPAVAVGLAFAWLHRLHRALLPLAVAGAMTLVFVVGPIFGLPLIGRYLRTPAELLTLFAGLAVAGWTLLPVGAARRRWKLIGLGTLALSILFAPWHFNMLRALERRMDRDSALYGDMRALAHAPAVRTAFARCAPLSTADHRPIPYLRYWLHGDPGSVGTVEAKASPLGRLLVVPRRTSLPRRFYQENYPAATSRRPAGYRTLYENRSWRVYAAPACVTRPPS